MKAVSRSLSPQEAAQLGTVLNFPHGVTTITVEFEKGRVGRSRQVPHLVYADVDKNLITEREFFDRLGRYVQKYVKRRARLSIKWWRDGRDPDVTARGVVLNNDEVVARFLVRCK